MLLSADDIRVVVLGAIGSTLCFLLARIWLETGNKTELKQCRFYGDYLSLGNFLVKLAFVTGAGTN